MQKWVLSPLLVQIALVIIIFFIDYLLNVTEKKPPVKSKLEQKIEGIKAKKKNQL